MAQEPVDHTQRKEELPNFAQQVFKIDLLREMILENAIWENKKICWSSVRALRLVQKSWLENITKLLEKHKKPLFHLELNSTNSLNANLGGVEGKLLDEFTRCVMTSSLSTGPAVPAFTLSISVGVFLEENHESLSNMLVHCGAGLIELKLDLYPDRGSLKLMFPSFSLPNLRKLILKPWDYGRNENVPHFINTLLNAAPSLSQFLVGWGNQIDVLTPMMDFQFFTLPPSITTLELRSDVTTANLDMLFKNHLPLLTCLTFIIPNEFSFPDGLLFRILDKFRPTLTKLTLECCTHFELEFVTKLRLPIMDRLEEFYNVSINCHLEDDIRSLEGFLPKLTKLSLRNQTIDMFRKWTQNSRFTAVEVFLLHLANEMVDEFQDNYEVGVNLERMQMIHLTFANVRKLEVMIDARETCGLKYLFLEMRQLTHLKIKAVGEGLDWDSWDALLIGAPKSFVSALRNSEGFWKKLQITTYESASIRDLKELTSLSLERQSFIRSSNPLISDLTFHFALLQMPKLQDLTLGVKFRASQEMNAKWKDQGRNLVYS